MRRLLLSALASAALALTALPTHAQTLDELISMGNDGIASVQCLLGFKYLDGDEVPQDTNEAIRWFRLAAEQDDVHAAYTLGRTYNNGEGVAQDYEEARKWFMIAARQGDANSQYRISEMYLEGHGVEKDLVQAYAWLSLAIGNGANKTGIRDNVERDLSPAQLKEAKELTESLVRGF